MLTSAELRRRPLPVWPSMEARSDEREALDLGVAPDEARRSLADIRFVNRWLGGLAPLVGAVQQSVAGLPAPTLLDVGCGSGDVAGLLLRRVTGLRAFGLDLKPLHLEAAPRGLQRLAGDVRHLPLRGGAVDVVTATLFLHHFPAADLPALLRSLFSVSRRALVVSDLRRSSLAYLLARGTFPLLMRSYVSVHDGLLSIRRSFTADDLRAAFAAADIPVTITRTAPFRLLAVARHR